MRLNHPRRVHWWALRILGNPADGPGLVWYEPEYGPRRWLLFRPVVGYRLRLMYRCKYRVFWIRGPRYEAFNCGDALAADLRKWMKGKDHD